MHLLQTLCTLTVCQSESLMRSYGTFEYICLNGKKMQSNAKNNVEYGNVMNVSSKLNLPTNGKGAHDDAFGDIYYLFIYIESKWDNELQDNDDDGGCVDKENREKNEEKKRI